MPTGMLFWPTTEEGKAPLGISPSSTFDRPAHHGRVSTFLTLFRIYTPPDSARGAGHLPVPVRAPTDSFPSPQCKPSTDF